MKPTSNKAELHITYKCSLACEACNRASFLKEPHTEDMTLDDLEEFFVQADALDWRPWLVIIGGEPTLHPQFEEFVRRCGDWSRKYVQVFSNQYTSMSRFRCEQARLKHAASINGETSKPLGSVKIGDDLVGWCDDVYVSPADFGETRPPCYQHSSIICGVSVDHEGYAPCALGGAIDALLDVGGRTKTLADLWDKDKVTAMTEALCKHCGHQRFRPDLVSRCEKWKGTPVSPTWKAAFEGRK